MTPARRAWLPHLVEAACTIAAATLLMGYEVYLHAMHVPATWITVAAVSLLAGPKLRDAWQAARRERLAERSTELLPEAEAALRLGPLLREHGHIVLLEVEEAIRRRALPPGRRHADGE